jgi:hypothetical protein
MSYSMKNKIVHFMLLSILIGISLCGYAGEVPRLFMLSKGKHIAFILPVSHIPLKVEQDGFLKHVVEKVFVRSTALYDESAPLVDIAHFGYLPCGDDDNQLPQEVLQRLLEKVDELAKYETFKSIAAPDLKVNDFAKMMTLLVGPIRPDTNNIRPSSVRHKGQVTTQLFEKYGIERISIESMHNFYASYCSLNSAEKIETVEGAIESVEATGPFSDALQSALYKEGIACMAALAGSQSACKIDRKTVAAKFVLAERNELWLEKINEISTKDGIPFYAFGAGHFLPNAYGPGLLTMLQKAGFTVKLIRTLSDVPPSILKRKPLKKRSRKEQEKL